MESHSSGVEGRNEEGDPRNPGTGHRVPKGWNGLVYRSPSSVGDLKKAALVTLKQRKGTVNSVGTGGFIT